MAYNNEKKRWAITKDLSIRKTGPGETVAHYQINVDRDKSGMTEREEKHLVSSYQFSQYKYTDNFKHYSVILSGNFSQDID